MTEPLTPNERDELASAYLDGELNQDGIALVEGDPELLDQVAEHREIQFKVGSPTPEVLAVTRAKHLASALAAFDQLGASDQVVDLTDQAGQREEHTNDNTDDNTVISLSERSSVRESRRSRSGMPSWLSAAAASVAVLGGLAYATTQFNGGSNDSVGETASIESGGADASATTFAAADGDMAEIDPASASAMEAPTEDAMGDGEAMEEELSLDDEGGNRDGGAEDDADDGGDGFSGHEAEIEFPAGMPASEIAMRVGNDGFPIEESICASIFEPPIKLTKADPSAEPDRFLPVIIGDQEAELFIYGPETGVLVDVLTCETIPETPSE